VFFNFSLLHLFSPLIALSNKQKNKNRKKKKLKKKKKKKKKEDSDFDFGSDFEDDGGDSDYRPSSTFLG